MDDKPCHKLGLLWTTFCQALESQNLSHTWQFENAHHVRHSTEDTRYSDWICSLQFPAHFLSVDVSLSGKNIAPTSMSLQSVLFSYFFKYKNLVDRIQCVCVCGGGGL